jgi:hypothetical protein
MLMLLALAVRVESSRVVCYCCCVYFNYMLDRAGWEEEEESWTRARSFLSCCLLFTVSSDNGFWDEIGPG